MKLNSHTISDILEGEALLGIKENRMLLFAFALNTGTGTIVKTLQEELKIKENDIEKYMNFFNDKDLITKKDNELISKLDKTKLVNKVDYEEEIINIINDLNNICKTNKKITEPRKVLVAQWLRKGYKAEQFNFVHEYFYSKWGNDPQMSEYLKPETLYNLKFPSRVEDSENAYKEIVEKHDSIYAIFNAFYDTYNRVFNLEARNVFIIPVDIQNKIAFWLRTTSIEDLIMVIESSIKDWSLKPELVPYISLDKILDQKFPARLSIAKKKADSLNLLPNKTSNDAVNNWLEE